MTLIKSLASPLGWVLLLMVAGLILIHFKQRPRRFRIGWCCLLAGTLILLVLSLEPTANWLTYSLECRHQPPSAEVLGTLDVVAVLGAGSYPSGTLRQEAELAREAYPRLHRGVEYFKNSRAGVIAFCGGGPWPGAEDEAGIMQRMAVAMGVPAEQILVEPDSRNTMMNAAGLARLLPQGEGRRIGVVTSAMHMMRSKWVFEQVFPHDTIVPLPAYFMYNPAPWGMGKITPRVGCLEKSTMALHEWIGVVWYALRY